MQFFAWAFALCICTFPLSFLFNCPYTNIGSKCFFQVTIVKSAKNAEKKKNRKMQNGYAMQKNCK
jgi:hypothetical protein